MKKAGIVARFFLAIVFLVFGFNKFFHFMPIPPSTEEMGALMGALFKTGYFFPMIAVFQIVAGALLLSKRFALLGAFILSPVLFNIFTINLFLNTSGVAFPAILFATLIVVLISEKDRLAALVKKEA